MEFEEYTEVRRTKKFFDKYARKYDKEKTKKYFCTNHKWIINNLTNADNKKMLDVGCGTGELDRRIASMSTGSEILGVDVSDEMIKKARQLSQGFTNLNYTVGDAHDLNCESNTYDYIFNTISFHHYHEPLKVIDEFYRILKPQGKLFLLDSITDPFLLSFMPRIWDIVESGKCYTRHLSSKEFENLFENSKFVKIEYRFYIRFFPARHILCVAEK